MENMTLGTIIRNARKAKGYSQLDLASFCGLSQTEISFIENNKLKPRLSTLESICNSLSIDLSELLEKISYSGYDKNKYILGSTIRNARIAKGYSQQDLASLCGMSGEDISRIECGKLKPFLATLESICNSLDIDSNEVLEKSGYSCYDKDKYSLGFTIRNARKAKGYSQQNLADLWGISREKISAIENGKLKPCLSALKSICAILSLDFEEVSKLSTKG